MRVTVGTGEGGRNPGLWFLLGDDAFPARETLETVLAGRIVDIASQSASKPGDEAPLACIVSEGLTFDLLGCSFDRAILRAQGASRADVTALGQMGATRAVVLYPGPHIAAVGASLTVVRALVTIGELLARGLPRLSRIYWPPSGWSAGSVDFVQAAVEWREDAAFPGAGIIEFRPAMGGALQSAGLAHFTGQELRIEGTLALPEGGGRFRAGRLAAALAGRERVSEAEFHPCALGAPIRIAPSANGRYVRASLA